MFRYVVAVAVLSMIGAGCFPKGAPDRMPVYRSVADAQGKKGPYFLDVHGLKLKKMPPLAQMTGMDRLSLRDNPLGDPGAAIAVVDSLTWIDISAIGMTNMPPELGNLKKLMVLYASDNRMQSIPPQLGNLENLNYLNLDRNQLKSLPTEIGKLEKLKWLRVNYNQLTELPEGITQLKNLKRLYARKNKITKLPKDIGNLKNLEWLLLEGNNIPKAERERVRKALPDCNIEF